MSNQTAGSVAESMERFDQLPMRVAMGSYQPLTDETLRLMKQLGVDDVLLTPHRHPGFESAMPMGRAWTIDEIQEVKSKIESHGLRLFAFEKMPIPLYEILLGDGDREAKTEAIKTTIRNLGEVGVPVLGYSGHPPDGAVRTSRTVQVRGDAEVSAFSMDDIDTETLLYDREYEEKEIWDAYESYLQAVLPVAEEASVKLGVHPSDPPIERLGGVPLLFRNFENFKRALDLVPSDNHGLKFCLGCWSEMGEDLVEVLRHFGGKNIIYVHFRDVVGTVPSFHETFIDDDESNFNEYEVMQTLSEIGFSGVMTPDHVPTLEGDTEWEFGSVSGRTFTVGYLKGLLKSINEQADE